MPRPAPDLAALQRQLATTQDIARRLRAIRALHIAAYNTETPVERAAPELFYAIGDILEGRKPEDLELKIINKEAFLRELTDS